MQFRIIAPTMLAIATLSVPVDALAGASVPFEIIASRNIVEARCHHTPGLESARTIEECDSLWQRGCLLSALPQVDFRRDMVIAYFGRSVVGGPSPEIGTVTRGGGVLTVEAIDHVGRGGFDVPTTWMVVFVVHKWPGRIEVHRQVQP